MICNNVTAITAVLGVVGFASRVTALIRCIGCAELRDASRGSLSKKFDVVDDDFFSESVFKSMHSHRQTSVVPERVKDLALARFS